MAFTWNKVAKPSGNPWTKVAKPVGPTTNSFIGGQPIGLLLALTQSTKITVVGTPWTKVSKPSGNPWTKINKAT